MALLFVALGSAVTLVALAYRGRVGVTLNAPRPAVTADLPDPLPALPLSIVNAPVSYDLAPAVAALEIAVPREIGDIATRLQAGGNTRAHFAFAARRAPFRIDVDSLTIRISSIVEYEGRGWYRPFIGPEVSAACGTSGVPRPRVRVTLVTAARLTSDWRLRTRTRIAELAPVSLDARDKCRITIFRIDITNRLINALRGLVERQLATLDRNIGRLDTPERFQSLWHTMQRPIRLTDSIWFTINPRSAQLGAVTSDSGRVVANLRLGALPRIATGPRPNDSTLLTAIPPLTFGDEGERGLHVPLEAVFSYPVASELLRRGIVGRSIDVSGRRIRVDYAELSGIGAGRVALGVRFGGTVNGTVYLTGTPQLDTLTRQVHVPDLEYDVGSARLLVRGVEWVRGVNVRDFLRAQARIPDSEALEGLRALAEQGMNRELTPGITLVARIAATRALGVHATTKELRVRALAVGNARLAISKAPVVKRQVPR
ncbi:MAG: DUF4403 family protein [Gemmatimonadaceae bacterium]